MILHQSAIGDTLDIVSESYCRDWRSLGILGSSELDRKVRAKGWNLFFMAGEIRAVVAAWGGHNTLRRGVKGLLAQTRLQHLNCLEVTHILRKHFSVFRISSLLRTPATCRNDLRFGRASSVHRMSRRFPRS